MPNAVTLAVYSSGTTQVNEPELRNAQNVRFDSVYPGGLYGTLSAFVPRVVTRAWQVAVGYRIVARNGQSVCWEGVITGLGARVGGEAEQGIEIIAAGQWGQTVGQWTLNKPWCDQRVSEDAWAYQTGTTGGGDQSCTIDRLNRIRFTPKGVAWASGDYAAVRYTAPTGQTVKRITYNYDLQEGAQAWEIVVYNVGTAADIAATSVTASGTGSTDNTLATPSQSVELRLYSRAAQTPTEDGTYYGQFSSVNVYTETGSINLTEIAKDVRAFVTALNSDETQIGSNTFATTPFVTDRQETAASVLQRCAALGDSSYNAWACYVTHSDAAATPDGKPVLVVEQWPVLTSYDYAIRIDEANVTPPLTIVRDIGAVRNWVVVRYRDAQNNRDVYLTPDDDSTLTDATSVAAYGRRAIVLNAGNAGATTAANYGRRYLAQYKNPVYYVSGPIVVTGYIRGSSGQRIPAANIRAGKRVKIENYLTDDASVSGAGLTFVISQASYTDDAQTCSLSTGTPDDLAIWLAREL